MKTAKKLFLTIATCACALSAHAQNPIIPTWYTPDPAPYVHGDTLYLFTDHDEDDAQYFKMKDYLLFSTTDMANWTYRGTPLSTATFSWARQGDNAWAAQCVERNGRWYWYVAIEDSTLHQHCIAVASAPSPTGPYTDPLGHALAKGDDRYIDPSVFIDKDGQAYLFWGNNGLWYAPLNEDMISLKGPARQVNVDDSTAFGPKVMKTSWKGESRMMTGYEEAPWIYRIGNTYFLEYAAGGIPEHLAYSTATNINGPWTYRGRVMNESPRSFTIHGGSVNFRGHDYMFYHTGMLPNGGGFRRSTAVEEFQRGKDGSIPLIPITDKGVKPIATLSPYQRVEAETMAAGYDLKTDRQAGDQHWLTRIHNGSWQSLRAVDFGKGAQSFTARVRGIDGGSIIVIVDGKTIATLPVAANTDWRNITVPVTNSPTGIHDLTLLYSGGDKELLEADWWQMK